MSAKNFKGFGNFGTHGNFGNSIMVIIDPPLANIAIAPLSRFVRKAQQLAAVAGEVDVLITGNRKVRELNRCFRKKDKATDVLSFPRSDGGGDIAISAQIAAANASRYGHATLVELKILILHGMLHLAGYDHEHDNGRMAVKENRLRTRLCLPVALIERSTTSHQEDTEPRRYSKKNFNSRSQHKVGKERTIRKNS